MEQEPKQGQSEEKKEPTYVQGDMFIEAEKEQKKKEQEEQQRQEEFKKHWDSKTFSEDELKDLYSKQEYYKGQD